MLTALSVQDYYSYNIAITITSTIVAFGSAVFGVYTQWRIWQQSRKSNVIVFLRPRLEDIAIMDVVIANVGPGVARDLTFESDFARTISEEGLWDANIWALGKNGMSGLPMLMGNTQVVQPFGISWKITKIPEIWPLTVSLGYFDLDGKKQRTRTFKLDPMPFLKAHQLGTPALKKAADALEKIAETLKMGSTLPPTPGT